MEQRLVDFEREMGHLVSLPHEISETTASATTYLMLCDQVDMSTAPDWIGGVCLDSNVLTLTVDHSTGLVSEIYYKREFDIYPPGNDIW